MVRGQDEIAPRVGIGMPVYNGERHIEEALTSICDQRFEDFELVILDNASTDNSAKICLSFAARDRRIRYLRNRSNYGFVHNFNTVFSLTNGDYFKWAAADDVCAPDFLARCVEVLDADPSIVLAYPSIIEIDETGAQIGPDKRGVRLPDMNLPDGGFSPDPVARFRTMMRYFGFTEPLYGLIRAKALARTGLHANHFNGDHILLAELCLHGRFYEIRGDQLFFSRVHAGQTTSQASDLRKRVANIDVSPTDLTAPEWYRLIRPYPRRVIDHLAGVRRAPLTARQRLRCYTEVGRFTGSWFRRRARSAVRRK